MPSYTFKVLQNDKPVQNASVAVGDQSVKTNQGGIAVIGGDLNGARSVTVTFQNTKKQFVLSQSNNENVLRLEKGSEVKQTGTASSTQFLNIGNYFSNISTNQITVFIAVGLVLFLLLFAIVRILKNMRGSKAFKASLKLASFVLVLGFSLFSLMSFSVVLYHLNGNGFTGTKAAAANVNITVNATKQVRPFDRKMKGIGLANWTFNKADGKPFVGQVQGLPQAIRAIDPGIIRYAGGLWANSVGFDKTKTQISAYTKWTKNGIDYWFDYGTDELIDLDAFAKSINAEVMLQVNISNNDPSMWAELVQFAVDKKLTSIKYYEFGNELDLETAQGSDNGITPEVYASRVAAYIKAMKAKDSSIQFVGGVPAAATDIVRNSWGSGGNAVSKYIALSVPAAHSAGKDLAAVSYHWYQADGAMELADMTQWDWQLTSNDGEFWREAYSRRYSEYVAPFVKTALTGYPQTKQIVSELGVNSQNGIPMNGNHLGALWFSDVLGRLAYNGVDWVTEWNSYASEGEYFSLMYPDVSETATPLINLRPTYYAYYMYAKYFGDQLVETTTTDPASLSVWASTDSKDPGKLKLRVTNMTASTINAPISLTGYSASTGQVYILKSTKPTDISDNSPLDSAPTTINGTKLNAMDVVGSGAGIVPLPLTVNGSSFTYSFPAYSSTAIVLSTGGVVPTVPPNATPTPTPTPRPTSVPTPTTVAVATPTPTVAPPTPTPVSASTVTSSGTSSNSQAKVGSTVTLTATINSTNALSNMNVDVEVYSVVNGVYTKVFQKVYSGESFSAGQTKTYKPTWTIPSNETIAKHQIMIGVFNSDWTQDNSWWNNNAGSFAVISKTAPTPTPAKLTISNVASSKFTSSSVLITWSTSQAGTTRVEYWTGSNTHKYTTLKDVTTPVTSHKVSIGNLTGSTRYSYRVHSKDASNVDYASATKQFTTQ